MSVPQNEFRVTTSDGKYTVVLPEGGGLHALRYGEPWRDLVGDNLVLTLAQDVETLRQKVIRLEDGKARLYETLVRIARAVGIATPLQLEAMAREDESYADVLARFIEEREAGKGTT